MDWLEKFHFVGKDGPMILVPVEHKEPELNDLVRSERPATRSFAAFAIGLLAGAGLFASFSARRGRST